MDNLVIVDKAWVYLDDCIKHRSIYYFIFKERFSKVNMIVAGFVYKGKLKIKRGENCSSIIRNIFYLQS